MFLVALHTKGKYHVNQKIKHKKRLDLFLDFDIHNISSDVDLSIGERGYVILILRKIRIKKLYPNIPRTKRQIEYQQDKRRQAKTLR